MVYVPAKLDLRLSRIEDKDYRFTFTDLRYNPPIPLNISGYVFAAQVRAQPGQTGAPLINRAMGFGLSIINASAGILRMNFTKAELDGLPAITDPTGPQIFYYDLTGQPLGGIISVMLEGKFIVYPGVTRP